MKAVTVIMRSKNSDWVIHQALVALFAQTFTDFELLVVDSGSTDRTLEIARSFPCRITKIDPGDYYPGMVLNRAIDDARGEIVVFQNSDAVPLVPGALQALISAFDDPGIEAAFGRQVPRPDAEPWVARDYAVTFPAAPPSPTWMHYSLPFAAMRRSTWKQHRFYTDAWGSEDSEWGYRAVRRGRPPKYVPDALVMHSHNYTLRQLFGRRFIEGEADAFVYRNEPRAVRLVRDTLASTARDIPAYVRAKAWLGLLRTPVRRAVYHWAYFRGHALGASRLRSGSLDASAGQQVVLERYHS